MRTWRSMFLALLLGAAGCGDQTMMTGPGGNPGSGPMLLSVTPPGDATGVSTTTAVTLRFSQGMGVGTRIKATPWLAGLPWNSCSKARRGTVGPVAIDVRPTGGKRGKAIARITMTRRAFAAC